MDTAAGSENVGENLQESDQRLEWERRRRRVRHTQDVGLAVLALGVLVLVYLALTYAPS